MATSVTAHEIERDNKEEPATQESLFSRMKFVLVAIGIAGGLATTGFICSFARDDFLGISVGIRSSYELTAIAGTFAVQTVLVLLQQLLAHWIVTLISFSVCTLILVHSHISSATIYSHRIAQFIVVFFLGVVGTVNLLFVYLPLVNLKDALINGLETLTIQEPKNLIACGTNKYWELIIDSRRITESSPDPISKIYTLCIQRRDSLSARSRLEAQYSYGLMFCCAAWLLLYFNRTAGRLGSISTLTIAGAVLVLGVNALFIPYMFGKVIQPTIMVKAQISSMQPDKDYAWEGPLLVISESEKSILALLLEKKAGTSHIVEIPRSAVGRINIFQTSDALQERIEIWHSQLPAPVESTQGDTQ
jgi:hypothetical protein